MVQILVSVANIERRCLKTKVDKGFVSTAREYELVDPKACP